ncbi:MAG: immunoglobulin domain-containing protein [Cytophagaceae bacterium]
MKPIKYLFAAICSLLISETALSQGQANVWYFGNGAGLDFNTNPPTILEDGNASLGALNLEGVGSMSDGNGNLLFYTDGRSVFNKNHATMPNGTGLLGGDGSSTQSGLCLPINGSTTKYFIISTDNNGNRSYFSIVDMSLQGGLGDVTNKNTALVSTAVCSEAVVAIPEYDASNNPTGENWIIFHDITGNIFREYKTNGETITFINNYTPVNSFSIAGQKALLLKTNGCFDKIAFSIYNSSRVEILPFNNNTGVISSPSLILSGTGGNPFFNPEVYGIEFSPNEQFLYVTESGLNSRKTIFQFDITLGTGLNPAAVLASKSFFTGDGTVSRFGHLQLGPDGKIYCPGFDFSTPTYMSVIPNPNEAWAKPNPTATQFEFKKYTYNTKRVGEGLPIFSQDLLRQTKIFYNNACEGGSTNFSFIFGGSAVSQTWDFGDPSSGSQNTSTALSPSHTYASAGTYTVSLTITDNCGRTRTTTINVIVKSGPTYSLPATLCPNTNITITGTGSNSSNYSWSLNATGTPVAHTGSSFIYNGSLPATVYVQDPTPLATYTTGNSTAADNAASDVGYTYFELYTAVSITEFQLRTRANASAGVVLKIQNSTGTTDYWTQTLGAITSGQTLTFTPNVTLQPGNYRFFYSDKTPFFRNNQAPASGGRNVSGVINIIGENNGTKGGSFINIKIALPDPCGIRAIPLANNCCVPPTITSQPSSITRCTNVEASFTAATSAASPAFQWQISTNGGSDWNNITGATSATYTIPAGNVTESINNSQYRVIITAGGCFSTSNAATLTINSRPQLTNDPLTTTVCEGANWSGVALTSNITGTTFAWTSNASAGISGNTASGSGNIPSQTFSNSNTSSGTVTYTVTPTANTCDGSTANIVVTVNPATKISVQPAASTTVCAGDAISLNVTVTGQPAITYQWNYNGNPINGSNSSNYSIASATLSHAGNYTVTATGSCGNITSEIAVVNVNGVNITAQPENEGACVGDVTFSVTATGPNLTYQWQENTGSGFADISGANNTDHTVANVNSGMNGYTYRVIISSNGTCSVTSNIANLVITSSTTIDKQPENQTLCKGQPLSLYVNVFGSGTINYQWKKDGNNVGTNSANFDISSVDENNAGVYTVEVNSDCGIATSDPATVTINDVTINNSPGDDSKCVGQNASFTVNASSIGTISYQWQTDNGTGTFSNIIGETGSTLSINSVTAAITGYKYQVLISDDGRCTQTSNPATLTVNVPVSITDQPDGAQLCIGEQLNLAVAASGTGPFTYQWKKDGNNIGTDNSGYTVSNVNTSQAGDYSVEITSVCGTEISAIATVTVNGVDLITSPADVTICEGSNIQFTANANGSGTITYQWQSDNGSGSFEDIVGENAPTLNFSSVTAVMSGFKYQVLIEDDGRCGVIAGPGILTVNSTVSISSHPSGTALCLGENLNLSATANGSGPLNYQWKKDGNDIGSNSANYSESNVTATSSGNYHVEITGTCGTVISNIAIVTVNGVTITSHPQNTVVCQGADASFNVTATGLGTLTYQWQSNSGGGMFTDILNETSNQLQITNTSISNSGNQYKVIISDNGNCPSESNVAVLTVTPGLQIINHPASGEICNGSSTQLSVVATGSGISYQWKKDGNNIGSNSASLMLNNVSSANGGNYLVEISSSCGNLSSDIATITILNPVINSVSSDASACPGENVILNINATGTGTISYQWQSDNGTGIFNSITGAQSSDLTINNVTSNQNNYKYQVVITDNGKCALTSSPITLTVLPVTPQAIAGSDIVTCLSAISLNANAGGEWKVIEGTAEISDKDNPTAVISNLSQGMNKIVWTITGQCGSTTDTLQINYGAGDMVVSSISSADSTCLGQQIAISIFATGGSGNYNYAVYSIDDTISKVYDNNIINIIPEKTTAYVVYAIDKDQEGCTSTLDTIPVFVAENQIPDMPNLITPNGDGKNDALVIRDKNNIPMLMPSSILVTNRFGQTVYRSENYNNTFDASDLADGVYYMHFKAGCGNNEHKGWLHVVR